jgi:molybdopterin molybdotransferase
MKSKGSGDFFKVAVTADVLAAFRGIDALEKEEVPFKNALGRVLAEDVVAGSDLPPFHRAVMDGYAVRASDTYGCSESQPAYLTCGGTVEMGSAAGGGPPQGGTLRISTGGMMPSNADAVVMWEYAREEGGVVEVTRPVAPGENMVRAGEDVREGETVLEKGRRLRPADIGLLAGLGRLSVPAVRPPKVAVLSTGDELVGPDEDPGPGMIRNVNQYSLGAWIQRCGGDPHLLGLVPDDLEKIRAGVTEGLSRSDMVLISGGSSAGTRDLTREVVETCGDPGLLFHGLAVRPGKPTVVGRSGRRPVFGLPGHPVSAMVVFLILVRPILNRMLGREDDAGLRKAYARLADNLPSQAGREDFYQVRLSRDEGGLRAHPVFRKSGLVISMVKGEGMVRVPIEREGLETGEEVTVEIYS